MGLSHTAERKGTAMNNVGAGGGITEWMGPHHAESKSQAGRKVAGRENTVFPEVSGLSEASDEMVHLRSYASWRVSLLI